MLTPRDRAAVTFAARVGGATRDQVAQALGCSGAAGYRVLSRCAAMDVIERVRLAVTAPSLYRATAAGLKWSGHSDLPVFDLTPVSDAHARAATSVILSLEAEHGPGAVLTEREFSAVERREQTLIGSIEQETRDGPQRFHRPDAVLQLDPELYAVETELSPKSRARLRRIIAAYRDAPGLAGVTYFTGREDVARLVMRVAREVEAQDRVEVRELPGATLDLEAVAGQVEAESVAEPEPAETGDW